MCKSIFKVTLLQSRNHYALAYGSCVTISLDCSKVPLCTLVAHITTTHVLILYSYYVNSPLSVERRRTHQAYFQVMNQRRANFS